MPRNSNATVDDSTQASDTSVTGAPSRGQGRKWLMIAAVGVVALIVGLLIGTAISAPSLDLCSYGIPNATNSSLLDSVDAFRIVMVNASFQEVNVTSQFCDTNLTAQQNASILELFNRSQMVQFIRADLAPVLSAARI